MPPEPPQDALDEEEDESPDLPEEAAEQAGASPCKAFLAQLEDQVWGWVRSYPNDTEVVAGRLEELAAEILDD